MKEKSFYAICPECRDNMQLKIIGAKLYLNCYHYQIEFDDKPENKTLEVLNGCKICFSPVIINLTLSGIACSNPMCPDYKVQKYDNTVLVTHDGFTVFETLKYQEKLHIGVFTTGTTGSPEVLQYLKDLFLKILEEHGLPVSPYLDLPVKEITVPGGRHEYERS